MNQFAALLLTLVWFGSAAAGVTKQSYSEKPEDLRITVSPAWTSYSIRYCFEGGERDLRVGDALRMKVVLMEAGALSAPCDSFELTGTLGKPGLPFGLEWLMLVGSFGVNWDQPIECGYELLDARFFRCPADSDSSFTFRVFFTEHDTTGRARIKGRMAELEEAIGDRNNSLKDVAAIAKLGRHKDLRPIEHAVLAEAFESGGDCDRYGDQLAAMERFGLSDPRYHEKFVSVCRMNAARAKTNSW